MNLAEIVMNTRGATALKGKRVARSLVSSEDGEAKMGGTNPYIEEVEIQAGNEEIQSDVSAERQDRGSGSCENSVWPQRFAGQHPGYREGLRAVWTMHAAAFVHAPRAT